MGRILYTFILILTLFVFRRVILILLGIILIFILITYLRIKKSGNYRFYYTNQDDFNFNDFNFNNEYQDYNQYYHQNTNTYNPYEYDEACKFFDISSSDDEHTKKRKYKKFIAKYHPDTYPDKKYANEMMIKGNNYWEIIKQHDNIS